MSKPFDAALKDLIAKYPEDWFSLVEPSATRRIQVIDADVSTVSGGSDKLLRVLAKPPWLLHVEIQANAESDIGERLHWYNTLVRHRHKQPVRTLLVLLRRAADSPRCTGAYEDSFPGQAPYVTFRYDVLRIWQMSGADLLRGGLGLLPLAPISDVARDDLPHVIKRIERRVLDESPRTRAAELLTTAFVLSGLRLPPADLHELFKGVRLMEESSAYRLILAEGEAKGAKTIITRLGRRRFGVLKKRNKEALDAITDVARLERLSERLLEVESWDELLATR